LFIKVKFFIVFLILINGCGFSENKLASSQKFENIEIETPNTKFNLILKNYLIRSFNNNSNDINKFILKSDISFSSRDTLSVNDLNVLKSTKGIVTYSLIDLQLDKIIKSGSIVTFPALSASSNSLYSNNVSLEHIKERLTLSSAKKLSMHIKLILFKLS
jgi:hypothetical protein